MGVRVRVGGDDVGSGGLPGHDPELAASLGAADQHGEQIGEKLRVLPLAAAEEERLRGARKQALPPRTLPGLDQVLERHRARLHIRVMCYRGGHTRLGLTGSARYAARKKETGQ